MKSPLSALTELESSHKVTPMQPVWLHALYEVR